jgi:hypothetical protein
MKFISNTGSERVIDAIRPWLKSQAQLDIDSLHYSLFAFAELVSLASQLSQVRLVVPLIQRDANALQLLGSESDVALHVHAPIEY